MPEFVNAGRAELSIRFPAPTADWAVPPEAQRRPPLLDAVGIDVQHPGSIRSWPGFLGLALRDNCRRYVSNYGFEDTGRPPGVLLVGPGIDHHPEAGGWKTWDIRLSRVAGAPLFTEAPPVKFVKPLQFLRADRAAIPVIGFVVMMPYTGPVADQYSPGLPPARNPGEAPRDVIAFIYYDCYRYKYDVQAGLIYPPGWRCRILNATVINYEGQAVPTIAKFPQVLDCASWRDLGFVTCFGASCLLNSPYYVRWYWGCPCTVDPGTPGYDYAESNPVTIYYDQTLQYVRVRPMCLKPSVDPIPDTEPNQSGNPVYRGTLETVENPAGLVENGTGEAQAVRLAITFWNSRWDTRTDIAWEATVNLGSAKKVWYTLKHYIHTGLWSTHDYVELWRSLPGAPGVIYREHLIALPKASGGGPPTHEPARDGNDTNYRRFLFTWGAPTSSTSKLWSSPPRDVRLTLVRRGLGAVGLAMQKAHDSVWEFSRPPGTGTTRIACAGGVTFIQPDGVWVTNTLDHREWNPLNVMRFTVQTSSLLNQRPEDFSDASTRISPSSDVGGLLALLPVGDFVLAVGTASTVAMRAVGDRLAVSSIGNAIGAVGRFACCSDGDQAFILSRNGLWRVDSSMNVQRIASADWVLYGDEEWGQDLGAFPDLPGVPVAYDPSLSILFITNVRRQEALAIHTETGAVTRLADFPWLWAVTANVPLLHYYHDLAGMISKRDRGVQKRAVFFYEFGVERGCTGTAEGVPLDFYVATNTDLANEALETVDSRKAAAGRGLSMHGDPLLPCLLETGAVHLLSYHWNQIASVSTQADGGSTIVTARHGTEADKRLESIYSRAITGSYIHLFSADGSLHVRRMITHVSVDPLPPAHPYRLTYRVRPALSAEEVSRLVGGRVIVAPVPMRVTFLVADNEESLDWVHCTGVDGQLAIDVPQARAMGDNGQRPSPSTIASPERMPLSVLLLSRPVSGWDDALAVNPPYPFYSTSPDGTIASTVIIPYARYFEVARANLVPCRRDDRMTFSIRAAAARPAVALEAFPAGFRLQVIGMRATVAWHASTRRS